MAIHYCHWYNEVTTECNSFPQGKTTGCITSVQSRHPSNCQNKCFGNTAAFISTWAVKHLQKSALDPVYRDVLQGLVGKWLYLPERKEQFATPLSQQMEKGMQWGCLFKVIEYLDFQSVTLSWIPPGNTAQPDKHMLTCDLSRLRREVDDMTQLFMHTETVS